MVVSVPSESDPVEYTEFFVEKATSRYESHGLPATLAYYSRPESVEGQWYVFIINQGDETIAHPDVAEEHGAVVAHSNPDLVGKPLTDAVHSELGLVTDRDLWVSDESTRLYVANYGGDDLRFRLA